MPSHFCICVLPSERPLDATLLRVPAQLPGIHLGDERGLIRQTPIKALAVKNADFDFSHVEPDGMFWHVMKDDTSQQRLCLLDTEHLLEALTEMGVEIVHHQMDAPRRGINLLEQVLYKSHEVGFSTMICNHDVRRPSFGSTATNRLQVPARAYS
jgi:hypothetical protein